MRIHYYSITLLFYADSEFPAARSATSSGGKVYMPCSGNAARQRLASTANYGVHCIVRAGHFPYIIGLRRTPFARPDVPLNLLKSFALIIALAISANAVAAVYMFTDENGAVHLSNVPADSRYVLLIADDAPAAPPQQAVAVQAQPAPPVPGKGRLAGPIPFVDAIAQVATSVGLDRALIHAVVAAESNYNARAVSRKGAAGLMQLMPQTAKRYAVQDSFDPLQNLQGGALYLRDLIAMFRGDVRLALAAYNAGPQAVQTHGNRIPPFKETENYVPKVLANYDLYRSALF
jgi:soluble lytic murein transglycosylase-like protein